MDEFRVGQSVRTGLQQTGHVGLEVADAAERGTPEGAHGRHVVPERERLCGCGLYFLPKEQRQPPLGLAAVHGVQPDAAGGVAAGAQGQRVGQIQQRVGWA